mmetsp:Transcript_64461/g.168761  ORF Transcript_64461/g.168761 Transcript_64461/m.168761 type:complete len:221 (-) Transcript_64461:277-939(-)
MEAGFLAAASGSCGGAAMEHVTKSAVAFTIIRAPSACSSTSACFPVARATLYSTTKEQHFATFLVTEESRFTIIPDSHASPSSVQRTATVDESQPLKKSSHRNPGSSESMTPPVSISPILMFVIRTGKGRADFSLKARSAKSVASTLKPTQHSTQASPASGTATSTEPSFSAVKETHEMQMRRMTCHCTIVYLRPSTIEERSAASGSFIWPSSLMKAPSR